MTTPTEVRPRPGNEITSALPEHETARREHLEIPHECLGQTPPLDEVTVRRTPRLIGLDVARGIALVGMVAVHTISATSSEDNVSLAWELASGKSSALFAVLGGVGLAFMTGRQSVPRGRQWRQAATVPLVRGLVIGVVGLLLGAVVAPDDAKVILPYLGLMFLMSALLLPLRTRQLLVLGLGWAVVGPIISHVIRAGFPAPVATNLTFPDVVARPEDSLTTLLITGFFPALTWISYLAIGMALGRADLGRRRAIAAVFAGGAALTVAMSALTSATMNERWLVNALVRDVQGHMSLDALTDHLVWGADGVLPTDSTWWLLVNAPHTATPVDLLYTIGISLMVIAGCLGVTRAFNGGFRWLSAPGSMTMTLYSLHLMLLQVPFLRTTTGDDDPEIVFFVTHLVVLTVFALLWSRRFRRGPLEWVAWKVTAVATRSSARAVG